MKNLTRTLIAAAMALACLYPPPKVAESTLVVWKSAEEKLAAAKAKRERKAARKN